MLLGFIVGLACVLGSGRALSLQDDMTVAVGSLNQARQAHGIQPLAWDSNLASYAQFWANQMASGQQPFVHATGEYRPNQGENLYERQSSQCDGAYENPLQAAMGAWLAQEPLYKGEAVTTGHEPWLHWSQCMWSRSTQIGCARAFSISEPYKVYDVCRFAPQGNIIGEKPF